MTVTRTESWQLSVPSSTLGLSHTVCQSRWPGELINDKIAKFRIALDYAGSEKDSESNSGYFDVTYYLKDKEGFIGKNASFVHGQITGGKMKKGSQISIIGRLFQERWSQDGTKRSKIVIIAEHVSYAAGGAKPADGAASASGSAPKYASVPEEF